MNLTRAIGLLVFAGAAVSVSAEPAAAVRKYTVFQSADLNITYRGHLYHVNQVDRGYFVILVDGKPVRVEPNDRAGIGIKVNRQFRIAPFSARIDKWTAERAYATGSDPHLVSAVELGEQRDFADATEQHAWEEYLAASGTFDFASMAAGKGGSPPTDIDSQRMAIKLANAKAMAKSPMFQSNAQAWKNATGVSGPTAYDAIRITFKVSSPRPLLQPFVLFVAVFHERGKPDAHRVWIGGRDLDAVDEHPQSFHLLQDGFPKGFELEKVGVHLYDTGGREVATNLSEHRMELTREETFSYLLKDYLAHHAQDTLPATAAMTAVPADWRARVRSVEYTRNYYVKVDENGHPQGLYQDTACTQPVDDPYLKPVVFKILFRPALQNGRPVPGVARVLPANLVQ